MWYTVLYGSIAYTAVQKECTHGIGHTKEAISPNENSFSTARRNMDILEQIGLDDVEKDFSDKE